MPPVQLIMKPKEMGAVLMQKRNKVCILYTGGTIGMVRSPRGYVPDRDSFHTAMDGLRALYRGGLPDWELVEFDPLLDSSNVTVREWNKIGRAVAERYEDFDGFVILHGTDTMAYSASALSFMLEGLDKPVVFTGAQIPLSELRSDGFDNIVDAVLIAAEGRAREVCLSFHGTLLRGCRATKRSADRFAAFESPNAPPLADAGITIRYAQPLLPPAAGPLRLREFAEVPVGVIKIFPGIQFEIFESIMTGALKGIVLETFGAGNVPSRNNSLLPIIDKACHAGAVITVCSQCSQGSVSLGAYETSSALKEIGAVDGKDMTTEAAFAKLYYLFSLGLDRDAVRVKMTQNLRGELTE